MDPLLTFNFKTDLLNIPIPQKLNNPFGPEVPEIAKIAAREFQSFMTTEFQNGGYDFLSHDGKMYGVLVVQAADQSFSYLGTVSGKLPKNAPTTQFIPSIFDDSKSDFFLFKGMTEVSKIVRQIRSSKNPDEVVALKEKSKKKSISIQKQLFESYNFLNLSGHTKNLIDIFKESTHGNPPAAAGECAGPKLLQYAISHRLKPIALTEFWWGNKNKERKHKLFYPACKNRCRPILEYMLEDNALFDER